MILLLFRKLLIDYSLDTFNEDMFFKLTSANWDIYVIAPYDELDAVNEPFTDNAV